MTLEATIASIKDDISYITNTSSKSDQISSAYGRLSPLVRVASVNSSLYAVARSFFIKNGASPESASILALISASLGKILKTNIIVVASEFVRQGLTDVNGLQSALSMLAGQGYSSFTQDTSESILTKAPARYIPPGSYTHPPVIITEELPDGTEFQAYSAFIEATDQDFGDIMVFTIPNLPVWLTMTEIRNGLIELTGTPGSGTAGIYPLLVNCTNPNGQFDQETLNLEVINVNEAPYFISSPTINTSEGASYTYNITTGDPDVGDTRTIIALTKPSWLGIVDALDGTAVLSGTVPYDSAENTTVTLKVTDFAGLFASQTYVISVSNVNRPPEFITDPTVFEILYDTAYEYEFEVFDPDGDAVVVEDLILPAWMTFEMYDATTGRVYGTPAIEDEGIHTVSLRVTDTSLASATQTFEIEVLSNISFPAAVVMSYESYPGNVIDYITTNGVTARFDDVDVALTRYISNSVQASPSTIVSCIGYNFEDNNGSYEHYLASWVFYGSLHCWFDFDSNVIEKFEYKPADWFTVSSGSIAYANDGQRYSTCLSETNTKCLLSPAIASTVSSTIALTAWVKLTEVSTSRMIFGIGNSAGLGLAGSTDTSIWVEFDPAKGFVAKSYSGTVNVIEQNNVNLDPDEWYFIVLFEGSGTNFELSVKGLGVDFRSRINITNATNMNTAFIGNLPNDAGPGCRVSHFSAYTNDDMYNNGEIVYLYNDGVPYTMDELGINGAPAAGLYALRYDGTVNLVKDAYFNFPLNVPGQDANGQYCNSGLRLQTNFYHQVSNLIKLSENRLVVVVNYLIDHVDTTNNWDWPAFLTALEYDPVEKEFKKICEQEVTFDSFGNPGYVHKFNDYLIFINYSETDGQNVPRLEAWKLDGNEFQLLDWIYPPSGVTFNVDFGFFDAYRWKLFDDGTYIYLTSYQISSQPTIYSFDGIEFSLVFHYSGSNFGENLGFFQRDGETYIAHTIQNSFGASPDYTNANLYVTRINMNTQTFTKMAEYPVTANPDGYLCGSIFFDGLETAINEFAESTDGSSMLIFGDDENIDDPIGWLTNSLRFKITETSITATILPPTPFAGQYPDPQVINRIEVLVADPGPPGAPTAIQSGNTLIATAASTGMPDNEMVASLTQVGNTVSSSAIVGLLATASLTQADNTILATSENLGVALDATLTATQNANTIVATAGVGVAATLTATQNANTIVATSENLGVALDATLTATQAGNTIVATALRGLQATASITQTGNTIVATSVDFASTQGSLLHFDGSDTSTTFTDETGKTWTASGNAQLSTSSPLYGTASGLFDGSGDFISTPSHADLILGANSNWKIEASVKFVALPTTGNNMVFCSRWNTSNLSYSFYVRNVSGTYSLNFNYSTTGSDTVTLSVTWSTPVTGTVYDIAVSREADSLRFFVNGTQIGATQTLTAAIFSGTANLHVGSIQISPFSYLNGRIDEFRLTKNATIVADYTPSLPFT